MGKSRKLFVLDTNVLIDDPASFFGFKEHDLFLPMATIEELDNLKKGSTDIARSCRQASRNLERIIKSGAGLETGEIGEGFDLKKASDGAAKGKLYLQIEAPGEHLRVTALAGVNKNDNEILLAALAEKERRAGQEVILVSRDINLRIKAAAMRIKAEDHEAGSALEDSDVIRTGFRREAKLWERVKTIRSHKDGTRCFWEVEGAPVKNWLLNEFISTDSGEEFCAQVVKKEGSKATLRQIVNHGSKKNEVWGLVAKSEEQSCALNLLLDPSIDLVTLMGQAGSGKTILTLAACLHMLYEAKTHEELIFTRITVPVGDDIGFLPGSEEEKMMPWMGALEDNLEELTKSPSDEGSWGRQATEDLIWSKIRVKSLNFMRGRTFSNKIVIIDEAQNLTAKQMKTLITRAGPGSKIICLGNLAQIDTPYLTEASSGLTHVVEGMKGYAGHGHATLAKVERSALAEFAGNAL